MITWTHVHKQHEIWLKVTLALQTGYTHQITHSLWEEQGVWFCLFVVLLPGESVCHSKYSKMNHFKGAVCVCVCLRVSLRPVGRVCGHNLMAFVNGGRYCDLYLLSYHHCTVLRMRCLKGKVLF